MRRKEDCNVSITLLAVYSVLFYLAWTAFHFFVEPLISKIPNEAVSSILSDGLIKNLIWTLPALILIRKNSDKLSVGFRDLFSFRKESLKYLWIFPAFAAYIIFGILIHGGTPGISSSFGAAEIITVIFVGITEEVVFRGWLLNATVGRHENTAIAINSVMFLAIHFPRWICEGIFVSNFVTFGFVSIVALSVIFSLVFVRTKSLVLPITLHMFWDLLVFMLY